MAANQSPKQFNEDQEEALKSILGDRSSYEYVKVDLPSNGLSYQKSADIRPFTFEDEKYALKHDIKKSEFMNVLLARCLKDLDLDSLFICDKAFLLFKLKEISTGSTVDMTIKCGACDTDSKLTLDLKLLNIKTMEEGTEIPLTMQLKVLDKEVVVNPARVRDEKNMISFDSFSNNLWRFVESIHGVTDKTVITEAIPKLPVEDVHQIMRAISMSEYGINSNFNYLCEACGNNQETEVPLSTNFFGKV